MNMKSAFALLSLSFLLTACGTTKVTSERKNNYDFSKTETYQWIAAPAGLLNLENTLINEDVQKTLSSGFEKRGIRQVSEASEADIQTAYHIKLREEQEYTDAARADERDFSGGLVYNRNDGKWSYRKRNPDVNVYTVEIGTLTVLAYDTKTGKRIWKGTLQTKINRSQPEEKQRKRIRRAVKKLLSHFPAGSR